MRSILIIPIATAAVLGLAATAQASSLGRPCTSAAPSQYLSTTELQVKAESLGYKVSKVKIAKACGEIYAIDKSGAKVEVFMDPTNGSVVGSK